VTQPLYRGGRTVAETSQAELGVRAARAKLVATEAAVLFSVIQAYFDAVRDQDLYDLAAQNEQLLRTELEGVRTQVHAGTLTDPDQLSVEAQYASAGAARLKAEGSLGVSRDEFLRAVGHAPAKLSAPKLRPVLPTSRGNALDLAAKNNPTVISALFTEDAGAKAIEDTRGQLLPTVSIVGDFNQYLNPPIAGIGKGVLSDGSVMVTANVPLYEGGAVYAQTRQALQTFQQLEHLTDDARRTAVQAAAQAWDMVIAARGELPQLKHAVKAGEGAFEGIKQEQILGTRTITDVLNAEQALFQLRVATVTAVHDLALSEFALAVQTGSVSAADFKLRKPLYDVERHYRSVRDKWFGFGSDDK
jgi:TolC family type I secretion outer membrane protein